MSITAHSLSRARSRLSGLLPRGPRDLLAHVAIVSAFDAVQRFALHAPGIVLDVANWTHTANHFLLDALAGAGVAGLALAAAADIRVPALPRQPVLAHRPAVGNGHSVELQMQLLGQVKRNLFGTL
jgi:hypothetical protein